MLYYTILYCTILCYTILCYTILIVYYTILYYTIIYYIVLYYTTLYYTILYYTILYYTIIYYNIIYYTILYSTILYYTLLYSTILYSTILYYNILYYTLLYSTILYYTLLYYTLLYSILLYSTLLYSTLLHYTLLYSTILYYTILYYTILYSLCGFLQHFVMPPKKKLKVNAPKGNKPKQKQVKETSVQEQNAQENVYQMPQPRETLFTDGGCCVGYVGATCTSGKHFPACAIAYISNILWANALTHIETVEGNFSKIVMTHLVDKLKSVVECADFQTGEEEERDRTLPEKCSSAWHRNTRLSAFILVRARTFRYLRRKKNDKRKPNKFGPATILVCWTKYPKICKRQKIK
eukprot:g64070.t1